MSKSQAVREQSREVGVSMREAEQEDRCQTIPQ